MVPLRGVTNSRLPPQFGTGHCRRSGFMQSPKDGPPWPGSPISASDGSWPCAARANTCFVTHVSSLSNLFIEGSSHALGIRSVDRRRASISSLVAFLPWNPEEFQVEFLGTSCESQPEFGVTPSGTPRNYGGNPSEICPHSRQNSLGSFLPGMYSNSSWSPGHNS